MGLARLQYIVLQQCGRYIVVCRRRPRIITGYYLVCNAALLVQLLLQHSEGHTSRTSGGTLDRKLDPCAASRRQSVRYRTNHRVLTIACMENAPIDNAATYAECIIVPSFADTSYANRVQVNHTNEATSPSSQLRGESRHFRVQSFNTCQSA